MKLKGCFYPIKVLLACMCCLFVGSLSNGTEATKVYAGETKNESLITSVPITKEYFPDEKFRKILLESYDVGNDGVLTEELYSIKNLQLKGRKITDLTGICFFKGLERLECTNNYLSFLSINNMPSLREIYCINNESLTTLYVSECPALTKIECSECNLNSLSLKDCNSLEELLFNYNKLVHLDLTEIPSLISVDCTENELTEINLTGLTELQTLKCAGNHLNNLELNTNTNLTYLECSANDLSELDVNRLVKLNYLSCNGNKLGKLDVSNLIGLQQLFCQENRLSSLDVSKLSALIRLDCTDNRLKTLELDNLIQLKSLGCAYNNLSRLNLSNQTELESLFCRDNELTELDLSGLSLLWELNCGKNYLTNLDLNGCGKIYRPYINESYRYICVDGDTFALSDLQGFDASKASNWKGAEYDVSTNSLINISEEVTYTYDCGQNISTTFTFLIRCVEDADHDRLCDTCGKKIEEPYVLIDEITFPDKAFCTLLLEKIDKHNDGVLTEELDMKALQLERAGISNLSGIECFTNLESLNCNDNNLNELDLSMFPSVSSLYCDDNHFTTLDLSSAKLLQYLYCANNELTKLDVSGLSMLSSLDCSHNNLSSLDVSGLSSLTTLDCSNNNFGSLDVNGLSALSSLKCNYNDLNNLDISSLSSLRYLECSHSGLKHLDVSKLSMLSSLDCSHNNLSSLDLSGLGKLSKLDCSYNVLNSLELSGTSMLQEMMCMFNNLSCLDLSECTRLWFLDASNNERQICNCNGYFELTGIPGFDKEMASDWNGAEFDSTTNSLRGFTDTVTYTYDCGSGFSIEFSFEPVSFTDENIDGYCDVCGLDKDSTWTDQVTDFVTRMYNIILEREPDVGSSTWINGLKDGSMTGVRVADGFVLSEEMLNKDISNEEFVKILYRAFFGREADAEGLATWKNLLDAGCKKTYVFAGFANSTEFGNLCAEAGIVQGRAAEYLADRQTGLSEADYKVWCFVERMYMEVLNRTADEPGVRSWVAVLLDGSFTGTQVADGFIMSDEFLAKNMTNEEYVRIMYRAFFGRDADAEGLTTWTNALATGWTKKDVFAGFANSNEFGVLCGQAGIVQGTAEGK